MSNNITLHILISHKVLPLIPCHRWLLVSLPSSFVFWELLLASSCFLSVSLRFGSSRCENMDAEALKSLPSRSKALSSTAWLSSLFWSTLLWLFCIAEVVFDNTLKVDWSTLLDLLVDEISESGDFGFGVLFSGSDVFGPYEWITGCFI